MADMYEFTCGGYFTVRVLHKDAIGTHREIFFGYDRTTI